MVALALWRPVVATAAMYLALVSIHSIDLDVPFVRLGLQIALGAVVYSATLLILWVASGRPPGPEALIVRFGITRFGGVSVRAKG
jgi:hypothetical protein